MAKVDKEPATLEQQLEAANQALAEKTAELEAFKDATGKEISELKKNIVVVKNPVVEFEGKSYEITRKRFGVIGIKGTHTAEDISKNENGKYNDLVKKLIDIKSAVLKEIV